MKLLSKAFFLFAGMHLVHFIVEYFYASAQATTITYNVFDFVSYAAISLLIGRYLTKKEELKDALNV